MPFDIDPKFIETKPDLSKPTLAGLAWLLRHPEAWPRNHQWTYSDTLVHNSCGTQGCAAGIAYLCWFDGIHVALENVFGLSKGEYRRIFMGCTTDSAGRVSPTYPGFHADVTPAMVADAIDAYLVDHPNAPRYP